MAPYTTPYIYHCSQWPKWPGGLTQVRTYVTMRVRKVSKWTLISEVHDRRIAPFSEPFPEECTLNSEEHLKI